MNCVGLYVQHFLPYQSTIHSFFWVSEDIKIVIKTRFWSNSQTVEKLAFNQLLTYRSVHWQWMFQLCMRKCLWTNGFQFLKRSGNWYYWDFFNSFSTGLCFLVLKSMHLKETRVSDICKRDWYFKRGFLWFVMYA